MGNMLKLGSVVNLCNNVVKPGYIVPIALRHPRLALFAKCAGPVEHAERGVAELRDGEFKCPSES